MKKIFLSFFIFVFMGLIISSLCFAFLQSLQFVNDLRDHWIWIILALPFVGLGIHWVYKKYSPISDQGILLVRSQSLEAGAYQKIPGLMLPLVLGSTILTHLFGGSAGREGVGLQIGAVVSDFFHEKFQLSKQDRTIFLVASLAAGFSALFGTPLTAVVFAFELFCPKHIRLKAILPTLFLSFYSSTLVHFFGYRHAGLSMGEALNWDLKIFIFVSLMALIFSLIARSYIRLHDFFKRNFQTIFSNGAQRIFWGGVIIVFLIFTFDLTDSMGLGLHRIEASFQGIIQPMEFFWKMLLTALTLACGFKGGEVTPLFFIGATLGNSLALSLSLPLGFGAGLGYVGVFAAATRAPMASTILGCELFGWKFFPYFALSHLIGYWTMGKLSIYQK